MPPPLLLIVTALAGGLLVPFHVVTGQNQPTTSPVAVPPGTPIPVRAFLLDDGSGVAVLFSTVTQAPEFECDQILTPESLAFFGSQPVCSFFQPDLLVFEFGANATLAVGQNILSRPDLDLTGLGAPPIGR